VVLNWNRRDETLACLDSILASGWPRLTAIVVDNASEQEIEGHLADRFPGARFVRNETNRGFAGGMNRGVMEALNLGVAYVLLLNNDTHVAPGMVRALVEAAEAHSDAGIVCPLVLYRDKPDVILSAGLRCDLRRGYQGPALGMGETDRGQFAGVRSVDAPSGAAMLVPAGAVREVGLLDEELFLYGEDVDWAQRMQAVGRRVYVVGEARLWHGLSASSGGAFSPLSAYFQTRNSFVVCARYAPLRGPRRFVRGADIVLANLIHTRRASRPFVNVRAVLAGWADHRRGRTGPGPEWMHSTPDQLRYRAARTPGCESR
jgi:hypothetical protein